jgi:ABC-2 type transport system ATP-binding protein
MITGMIRTWELTKRYRRREALKAISLEIPDGGVTALVGPNGAGKSTLLKLCIGFERPTSGRLEVNGVDPVRERARSIASIGYVPQTASLYRDLSVADHLRLASAIRPGFDAAHARERLRPLGIPVSARVGELSGGEQSQVCLAIALGTRAPLLLLDEPLANLDPLARRDFLRVARLAANDGTTVVLSSHALSEIEETADRLLVLGEGRVLYDDTVEHSIATHRVIDPGADLDGVHVVASFPGRADQVHILGRTTSAGVGRAPTLEEVVLGYLAEARSLATADLDREVAA